MKFAVIGAGAVGGFYGALLSKAGHDVAFVARGAHREAMLANGLKILSAPDSVGGMTVRCQVESDPAKIGVVDVVILAVKTYSNAETLPALAPLFGPETSILTLQNGVDSAEQVAAVFGEARVIGGATYIAAGIEAPGVIRHNGTHRRIVFGEYFNPSATLSPRVAALEPVFAAANIQTEAVVDIRPRLWEKFIYLAPMAAFTGVPKTMRSSLLIDLSQGKKIEVEALQGSVVRRGQATGVPTPIMSALYAVLKPHAEGPRVD